MAGGRGAYQGIPLTELRIEAVDWTHRAEHIRHRSTRHGPTEAALDARRLVAVRGAGPSSFSEDQRQLRLAIVTRREGS